MRLAPSFRFFWSSWYVTDIIVFTFLINLFAFELNSMYLTIWIWISTWYLYSFQDIFLWVVGITWFYSADKWWRWVQNCCFSVLFEFSFIIFAYNNNNNSYLLVGPWRNSVIAMDHPCTASPQWFFLFNSSFHYHGHDMMLTICEILCICGSLIL